MLLVATALAFVYTESLKLTPSPIAGTTVTKLFSPICACATDTARIAFRLRTPDGVTIEIVSGQGALVRRLITREERRRGRVEVIWNGRDSTGAVVPEGVYRPRVHLDRQRRTIVLPNPIRVDTTPPRVRLVRVAPSVFSPDGDQRADRVVVAYHADEPGTVALYVDGKQAVVKRGQKQTGTIDWYGTLRGAALPRGVYRLSVAARDLAGNAGRRSRERAVVLRFVVLGRTRITTAPGARFALLVSSDAGRVGWMLGQRRGEAKPGTLRLRAPLRAGRFTLTVTANGHAVRAAVIVRKRPQ